jgi:hypothetical protein
MAVARRRLLSHHGHAQVIPALGRHHIEQFSSFAGFLIDFQHKPDTRNIEFRFQNVYGRRALSMPAPESFGKG